MSKLNDLIMNIVISLAKNEDFVKIKYEDLKEPLLDYLRVLLNKCLRNDYPSIVEALNYVQYLVQSRRRSMPSYDAILIILNQLEIELKDAKLCFDCVYNKVMVEDGFGVVCSRPHLLIWCEHYATDRSPSKRKQFPYWVPTKVISIDGKHFYCRSFIDGCSKLRKRRRTLPTTETLSLKTQSNLGDAYLSLINAIHMLNIHLDQLRKKFGNTKSLYREYATDWNRDRIELRDNHDIYIYFPDFEPEVLCNK